MPTPDFIHDQIRAEYARSTAAILDASAREIIRQSDRMIEALNQALRDVIVEIRDTPPELWTSSWLELHKGNLLRIADEMGLEMNRVTAGIRASALAAGEESILMPLRQVGLARFANFPSLDPRLLEVAATLTADYITELSRDWTDHLARRVGEDISAGKTPYQTQQGIHQSLRAAGAGDAGFTDRYGMGTLYTRAHVIARTEGQRIRNVAQYARALDVADRFPGTTKRWDAEVPTDGRTRASHLLAHGQEVPVRSLFTLISDLGRVRLRYPTDPGGEGSRRALAAETIQCRCACLLILPRISVADVERKAAQLGIVRPSAPRAFPDRAVEQMTAMRPRRSGPVFR